MAAVKERKGRKSLIIGTIFISVTLILLFVASTCFAQVQWAADGVAVCVEGNHQETPQLLPDGQGGAIITWSPSTPSTVP